MNREMNNEEGGEKVQINMMRRGLWTEEEDRVLSEYMRVHRGGRWNRIPKMTGLKRCGKSCRLRWLNYLSPTVKRGDFSEEEEDLIIRLHKLLGNRWSLIAGRIPGRTDNQVKNHWNTHLSKKLGIKNQNINSKIWPVKQLPTVDACSSSPQHHHEPDDDHNRSISNTSVSNSTFKFFDQQQDCSNKDNNNKNKSNYLEQYDEENPVVTSRLRESSYSCCYDDPHDSLMLYTGHSHLDFLEIFNSSTFDMNRVL